MQINITFFFQAINFLISYWFLNKFLFKPVFDYINNKKIKEKRISEIIEKKEHELLDLEENKHRNLSCFKQNLQEKYKFIFKKEFDIPSSVKCEIKKNEVTNIIKKMKFLLLKKVPHVD